MNNENSGNGIGKSEDNLFTMKILVQGQEILSLIDNMAEGLEQVREESGTRINVSEGSIPDRIVTVTGSIGNISCAIGLIAHKFEVYLGQSGRDFRKSPLVVKFIVPATQCGSLIGKGGMRIKEIREQTGTAIQVAADTLPKSSERVVNVTGPVNNIAQCAYQICTIISTSPSAAKNRPYQPYANEVQGPILFSEGIPYTIQGPLLIPVEGELYNRLMKYPEVGRYMKSYKENISTNGQSFSNDTIFQPPALGSNTLGNSVQENPDTDEHSAEMFIPNELVGCVIGKGGTKIGEIRQISGAQIHIFGVQEREDDGSLERKVTIHGTSECIELAQCLISISMELQKINMDNDGVPLHPSHVDESSPLLHLMGKSGVLESLTGVTHSTNIVDILCRLGVISPAAVPKDHEFKGNLATTGHSNSAKKK